MDAEIQYKTGQNQAVEQLRIGDQSNIERVRYSTEIKGPEDLEALRRAKNALDTEDPLMISAHRAQKIRMQPRFREYEEEIRDLFTKRPVLYFEPPELFRYRRPQQLITYNFRGDVPSIKKFYSKVRNDNHNDALSMLHPFIRPFIQAQYDSLLNSKDNLPDDQSAIETSDHVYEAWGEDAVDNAYPSFISNVMNEAQNTPDSGIIAPVPPVMKSSAETVITRTAGYNDLVWEYAKTAFEDPSAGTTTAYLHFYTDKGVFSNNSNNDGRILNSIRSQLEARSYSGVAITISNYDRIWEAGLERNLERFMSELDAITNEYSVPLVAPRSGYYGMYMTDMGVDIFSSMMNGNVELNRKGGAPSKEARFGKIPIYDACRNVNIEQAEQVLRRRRGKLYSVPGVPDSPPMFNPKSSGVGNKFGKPKRFRIEFGKQRRLLHLVEAQEIRQALVRGTADPATQYFRGSEHPHLD